jgi:hypothetical protein
MQEDLAKAGRTGNEEAVYCDPGSEQAAWTCRGFAFPGIPRTMKAQLSDR